VGRARLGLGLVGKWDGWDATMGGRGRSIVAALHLSGRSAFAEHHARAGAAKAPPSWFYTSAHPRLLTAVCAHAFANSFPLLPLDKNFELRGVGPADSVTYPR
jgi:hypothetical protein